MGSMPIHKATIVPRGNTLGMVAYLPEKDQMNLSREQLLAHIDICMGGRVAEEIIFGKHGVTTGAGSDLQQATSTARNMVTKYGMSATLGPHYYSTEELEKLSSGTREAVENEVREMLTRAENNGEQRLFRIHRAPRSADRLSSRLHSRPAARRILSDNVDELHKLAKGLLEHETLTLSEIKELLANKKGELKSK